MGSNTSSSDSKKKRGRGVSPSEEYKVALEGYTFNLRIRDRHRLDRAVLALEARLSELSENHPTLKPRERYLLLLLELSYEREEFQSSGKALLKQTNQLLEWIDHQIDR